MKYSSLRSCSIADSILFFTEYSWHILPVRPHKQLAVLQTMRFKLLGDRDFFTLIPFTIITKNDPDPVPDLG